MTAAPRRWAAELLHVWFHDLRPVQWWSVSETVDAMLRRRFAPELGALGSRPAREFLTDPLTARASILLFDQVPRNVHRGTPLAFAFDSLARQLTWGVVARGWDRTAPRRERPFIYMPLMHSEGVADQLASLRLFASEGRESFAFARSHHRMIARFGRFPHRNAVLGRKSSPAERAAVEAGYSW